MNRKSFQKICVSLLLIGLAAADSYAGEGKPSQSWVRSGELGAIPQRIIDALPLSDQADKGNWRKYESMSDEFEAAVLDSNKWHPRNPGWLGRQPAYFYHGNVTVSGGKLNLAMRKQEVPEMPRDKGYHSL